MNFIAKNSPIDSNSFDAFRSLGVQNECCLDTKIILRKADELALNRFDEKKFDKVDSL